MIAEAKNQERAHLGLHGLDLDDIPDLQGISELNSIALNANHLKSVPERLKSLKRLFALGLQSNQIESIPDFSTTIPNSRLAFF